MFMIGDMTDQEALDFLARRMAGKAALAEALSVSAQRLGNWYARGISAGKRPVIWAMVNDHGGNLSRDWLLAPAKPEAA